MVKSLRNAPRIDPLTNNWSVAILRTGSETSDDGLRTSKRRAVVRENTEVTIRKKKYPHENRRLSSAQSAEPYLEFLAELENRPRLMLDGAKTSRCC